MDVLAGSMEGRGSVGVDGFMGLRVRLVVVGEDEDEVPLVEGLGAGRAGWPGGRRGRMGCEVVC